MAWLNKQVLAFSLIVTLAMNGFDMLFHLLEDTAVHLGYVAVKFTVIFLTVFLIVHIMGRGKEQGIVTSITGPAIFYVYYRYASPTLDRTLFKLDENVTYLFLHAAFLGIAYYLTHSLSQREGTMSQPIFKALLASLAASTLEMGYHMTVLTPTLVSELKVFESVSYIYLVLAVTFALVLVKDAFWSSGWIHLGASMLLIGLAGGLTLWMAGWSFSLLDSVVRAILLGIAYSLTEASA